jgi:hypothetical protein
LDRARFPALYECLAQIVEKMTVGFPSVWKYAYHLPLGYNQPLDVTRITPFPFSEPNLQMVVKITDYQLAPGAEYEDPDWHIEGLYPEQIIMTAICCLHRDPLLDGGSFQFEREIDEREGRYFLEQLIALDTPTKEEPLPFSSWIEQFLDHWKKPLGKVTKFQTGDLILFPNCHSYRQEKLWNPLPIGGACLSQRLVHIYVIHPNRPTESSSSQAPHVLQRNHISREVAMKLRTQLRKERKE